MNFDDILRKLGIVSSDDLNASSEADLPPGVEALEILVGPDAIKARALGSEALKDLAETLNKAFYISRYATLEGELRHKHGNDERVYSGLHIRFPLNTLMDINTARVSDIYPRKGDISRIFQREVEILVDAKKPDAPQGDYCEDVRGSLPPGYRKAFSVPKGVEDRDIVFSSDGTFLNIHVDVPESLQEAYIRNVDAADEIEREPENQRDMIVSAIDDYDLAPKEAIAAVQAYYLALYQVKRDRSSFMRAIESTEEFFAGEAYYMDYIAQMPHDQLDLVTRTGVEHKLLPKAAIAVATAFYAELALREIEREEKSGPLPPGT